MLINYCGKYPKLYPLQFTTMLRINIILILYNSSLIFLHLLLSPKAPGSFLSVFFACSVRYFPFNSYNPKTLSEDKLKTFVFVFSLRDE